MRIRSLGTAVPIAIAIFGAPLVGHAQAVAPANARTGWESIPPREPALVCSVVLKEQRQVLHRLSSGTFQPTLVSEPVRLSPAELEAAKQPTIEMMEADQQAWRRYSEATQAYLSARTARFKDHVVKSRPQEAPAPSAICKLVTFMAASNGDVPLIIGAELRGAGHKGDLSWPVYGVVYHEDFLPPNWTKGLPPFTLGAAGPVAKPPAPSPRPALSTSASLTIKTDASLRDAGKAWDEQIKKTLAAEAKTKAEAAARTLQADTKKQAEIDAFFNGLRRQGRAQ